MTILTPADFEQRYREDPDPWRYRTSRYERAKYAATLAACGPGRFEDALELGGSIGEFSALLAPRCRRLRTLDASPTAVAVARGRLAGLSQVTPILGEIPHAIPAGPYDLVVASEILYYLGSGALDDTLTRLGEVLGPGGHLVCVHWRPSGPERPLDAATVHARVRAQPWLALDASRPTDDYLLDVLLRR